MASISERESREIEAANASGTTPVVFIHGLWLLPSSWANWANFFKEAGYAPLTPDWPDDPETVEGADDEVGRRRGVQELLHAVRYRDGGPGHEQAKCCEQRPHVGLTAEAERMRGQTVGATDGER